MGKKREKELRKRDVRARMTETLYGKCKEAADISYNGNLSAFFVNAVCNELEMRRVMKALRAKNCV
ncbi:MAG: hypothetical protein V2I97_16000 [Desulfococcaceae bacterium]|jgi:hypothetical protein|nr:hypothetical protein [Desulfococcaceae bacterium]